MIRTSFLDEAKEKNERERIIHLFFNDYSSMKNVMELSPHQRESCERTDLQMHSTTNSHGSWTPTKRTELPKVVLGASLLTRRIRFDRERHRSH